MTYTANPQQIEAALQEFEKFDVDTQLAILWFGYLDIKEQLNPTNTPSAQDMGETLYHHFLAMSPEGQLNAQREIAGKANSDISRAYSALSSSGKLDVWLRLAQGMEEGKIINLPENYQLPPETESFTQKIKQLNFEDRINFSRAIVIRMGA